MFINIHLFVIIKKWGDCKNNFGSTYLYVFIITKYKRTILCTDYFVKCAEAQGLEHNLKWKKYLIKQILVKKLLMISLMSTLIIEDSKKVNYDSQLGRKQILMGNKLQIKEKFEVRYEWHQIIKAILWRKLCIWRSQSESIQSLMKVESWLRIENTCWTKERIQRYV